MTFDEALVAGKLRRWEIYMDGFCMPSWEEIPDFGLYMEQVIQLMETYLSYLPPELREEQFVTAAAINNYVRKGVMPKPVNKKYYRVQIAYLLLICTLKQRLTISTIQTMIPADLPEEEFRQLYQIFRECSARAAEYFVNQVRIAAGKILGHKETSLIAAENTTELVMESMVISLFSGLLGEKLLFLEGKDLTNGGSIEPERKKERTNSA